MEQENRKFLYVKSGEDIFLIVLDINSNKEISRTLLPTVTFSEAARFGIADHRIETTERVIIHEKV
jgi:hypothetical protein